MTTFDGFLDYIQIFQSEDEVSTKQDEFTDEDLPSGGDHVLQFDPPAAVISVADLQASGTESIVLFFDSPAISLNALDSAQIQNDSIVLQFNPPNVSVQAIPGPEILSNLTVLSFAPPEIDLAVFALSIKEIVSLAFDAPVIGAAVNLSSALIESSRETLWFDPPGATLSAVGAEIKTGPAPTWTTGTILQFDPPIASIHAMPMSFGRIFVPFHRFHFLRTSLGTEKKNKLGVGLGLRAAISTLMQVGTHSRYHVFICGMLSRGDHAPAAQTIAAGLVKETRKLQVLENHLSGSVSILQAVSDVLARGDGIAKAQGLIDGLIKETRNNQALPGALSAQIEILQSIRAILSRGDHAPAAQANQMGLTDAARKISALIHSYSETVSMLQKIRGVLSGDPASAMQQQLVSLLAANPVHARQIVSAGIFDGGIQYYSTAAEIYIDGRAVSAKVSGIRLMFDENSVHNEITMSSADPDLFLLADPEKHYGQIRIEAQVGTRMMQFLLDARPGEKTDFQIAGVSVSAKEDAPYAADVDFSLSAPMMASEIAAGLTNFCPVEWTAHDWMVPAGFAFYGPPIDGIQELASAVGAVVRCQDDGGILVRPRRPVRPVHMDGTAPDVSYDQADLIVLNQEERQESGHNAVRVTGRASEIFVPQMRLEPIETDDGSSRGPEVGETCFVRVYWAGRPAAIIDAYVTDGTIEPVGDGAFFTDLVEEVVEFKDGLASVNLPIYELAGKEWIGDSGGEISHSQHGTDLSIQDARYRVARVKYRTRYQRYRVAGHNVERLIAVLFLSTQPDVDVRVRLAAPARYGPAIEAPLLTDQAGAVARGSAWIDQQYRRSACTLTAPYNDAAADGGLAFINDAQIGAPGNYHIETAAIVIDGPKVTNELTVEKCLTSFNT